MKSPIRRFIFEAPVLIAAFAAVSTQAGTVFVGNSVTAPVNGSADSVSPFVILGEYNPAGPSLTSPITLPTGNVTDVKFYGGNYNFTLYALSETAAANNEVTFQVAASQTFAGSLPTGTQTLPVTGFHVNAGELLAFGGVGPYYPQQGNDALGSDATYESSTLPNTFIAIPPGGPGSTFTVGINGDANSTYDYVSDVFNNQGRTYAIGVEVNVPDGGATYALFVPALGALAFFKRRPAQKI